MSTKRQDQLRLFLSALFHESDIVEVRPIEIWTDASDGRRKSKVLRRERQWLLPNELLRKHRTLSLLNVEQRANIFMGVNPRFQQGVGRKCDVRICRSLWADMDEVSPEVARWRCHEVGVPDPSIVVDSGGGAHLYWLLGRAVDVSNPGQRQQFEDGLKRLYRRLGTDATSDVNRLLRLPDFWNIKDARSGRPPRACRLIRCVPNRRFEVDQLLIDSTPLSQPVVAKRRGSCRDRANDRLIQGVLSRLDRDVNDRSRRDFGVVCSLLRLGVRPHEIWQLVRDRSKFASNGCPYFETTLQNALKATTGSSGE